MVHLNRIYTKSGDGGQTSLGNGERVSKTSPRIRAIGAVDEINAALGLCVAQAASEGEVARRLRVIQNDLFDLGADLCLPEGDDPSPYEPLRIKPGHVTRLEGWIDEATAVLQPLSSFILPGGSQISSLLHLARTICRRAEIEVTALSAVERVTPEVLKYLNRLSDLLFVMARLENNLGADDVLWVPGKQT